MKRGRGYFAGILALTAILIPSAFPFQQHYPIALGSSSLAGKTRAIATTFGLSSSTAAPASGSLGQVDVKRQERKALIRKEGGRFAFDTKYGALNPFAIYYGLLSIVLGIPWYIALTMYQLFQLVTFGKMDKRRRIPIFVTHIWGTLLMRLTGCYPKIENMDVLKQLYKR